jgi:hypothetical protein
MMIGALLGVLGWSATAAAQWQNQLYQGYGGYGGWGGSPGFGGGFPGNGGFMPNIYNPQSQPLSPYLNMFRGNNNPAANYYFGTRPGTVGGVGGMMGGAPNIAFGGPRGLFFPQLATTPDPLDLPEADPASHTALPPSGHPVFYGNTMGYFPNPFGYRGMGGMRPGMMGGGNRGQQGPTPRR